MEAARDALALDDAREGAYHPMNVADGRPGLAHQERQDQPPLPVARERVGERPAGGLPLQPPAPAPSARLKSRRIHLGLALRRTTPMTNRRQPTIRTFRP